MDGEMRLKSQNMQVIEEATTHLVLVLTHSHPVLVSTPESLRPVSGMIHSWVMTQFK